MTYLITSSKHSFDNKIKSNTILYYFVIEMIVLVCYLFNLFELHNKILTTLIFDV